MREIFCDHQTTLRIHPSALQALKNVLKGEEAATREALYSSIETSMKAIFSTLKKNASDYFFLSSCREESVKALFCSFAIKFLEKNKKGHFVITSLQETELYQPLEEIGCKKSVFSVNAMGEFDEKNFEKTLQKDTAFVSVIFSHPQTGCLLPIKKIAEICQKKNIGLHVDFPGCFTFPSEEIFLLPIVEYVTWGAENFQAPSLGFLFSKEKASLHPLMFSKLSKTEKNPPEIFSPYIHCLAKICLEKREKEEKENMEISYLKNLFEKEVGKRIENTTVIFSSEPRVSHVSAISFFGVNSEALVFSLKERNVFANFFPGQQKAVIEQLISSGFSPLIARSTVSFTFDASITKESLLSLVEILVEEVQKLRKLSTKIFGEDR
jgi:cysteine desulfurase